ncbi:MAG: hypothetical protein FWF77_07770 [Defluviitaleaceae bacterium]|nr:hypothetical protein [Defluviitaleaceae bacterium]
MRFRRFLFAALLFMAGFSGCGDDDYAADAGESEDPMLFLTHYTAYIQGALRPNDDANLVIVYVTTHLYAGDDNFFEEVNDIRVRIVDVSAAGNVTVSWDSDQWDDTIFSSRDPSDIAAYFTEHLAADGGVVQYRTEMEVRGVATEENFVGTIVAPDIGYTTDIRAYAVESNVVGDEWSVNFNGNWIY